jgi:peptidyl-prolyl cis-trans isomerase C
MEGIMKTLEPLLEQLQPLKEQLSKPVLGPFTGFHFLFFIFYYVLKNIFVPSLLGANKNQVKASHILVKTEQECKDLKKKTDDGALFEELAEKHSTCPSGKSKGSLGKFGPGSMVKEFDAVCFDKETVVGKVYGPIKTQFGYHLIRLDEKPEDKKNQ